MTINKEKVNILVAEDEACLRDILKVTLEQEGYRAILASDGDETIKKMEKESFQMALVDMKMPGVSGKELVSKIKQINPLMPIIIITGSLDFKDEMNLKKQVYQYIYKPFKLDQLIEVIKGGLKHS